MDHEAKNERLTMQAAALACGDMVAIRHGLHSAEHDGWMRGFAARDAIQKKYGATDLDALYFVLGWVCGALVMFLVLRAVGVPS